MKSKYDVYILKLIEIKIESGKIQFNYLFKQFTTTNRDNNHDDNNAWYTQNGVCVCVTFSGMSNSDTFTNFNYISF